MPTIPTGGTTTQRIATPQLSQPEQTVAQAQAIGGLLARTGGMIAELDQKTRDARQKHDVAVGLASLTAEFGQIYQDSETDPNIDGSASRANLRAEEALQRISETYGGATAAAIKQRGVGVAASMGVQAAGVERNRFNANAQLEMEQFKDDSVVAVSFAKTPLERDQKEAAFRSGVASSDFMSNLRKAQMLDDFEAEVSATTAERLLVADPDALVDTIENEDIFPGLKAAQREKLRQEGLGAADKIDKAELKAADDNLKDLQDNNLRDFNAAFVAAGGQPTPALQSQFLDNLDDYSVEGSNTIRAMLTGRSATSDDPATVILLNNAINSNEPDVVSQLNAAFKEGTISLGTFNSKLLRHEDRNLPRSTPAQRGHDYITNANKPNIRDSVTQSTFKAARFAIVETAYSLYLQSDPPPPQSEMLGEAMRLMDRASSAQGIVAVTGANFLGTLQPYGTAGDIFDMTNDQLNASRLSAQRAFMSGKLSGDQAILEVENIERVRAQVEIRNDIKAGGNQ